MKKFLPINIPVPEFIRRLSLCNGIAPGRIFLVMIYLIKLIIVMPVTFLQFLFYNRRINKTNITKQPVFILGHYRSGTTYLHKLMSVDANFGFIKTYDIICPNSSLLFGKWLQNFLQYIVNAFHIKTSFFNNHISNLDEPAEEERFLINKGSVFTDYWRFVFPQCWNRWQSNSQLLKDKDYNRQWKEEYLHLLKLITFRNKGKQLILKSPPNTERIKYLLEMFPDAKFIYISRNPYYVFYSTINMWKKAITKFRLQNISDKQIEEIVFNEYAHLIDQYQKHKDLIPAENLIEISYDDLEAEPLTVLKNIYAELNLPDFKNAQKAFSKQFIQEKKYQKYKYEYDEQVFRIIKRRWAKYIHQWESNTPDILVHEYIYFKRKILCKP